MSGFTGSSDIEDVVSSVRRLVSVDGRTRPVTRDLGNDLLLLTPALRFVPEPAHEPETDPAPTADVTPVEEPAPKPLVLEDVVATPDSVEDMPADPPATPDAATLAAGSASGSVASPPMDEVTPEMTALVLKEATAPDLPADQPPAVSAEFDAPAEPAPTDQVPTEAPASLHLVEEAWEDEIWAEDDPPLAELALGVEEAEVIPTDPPAEAVDGPNRPSLDRDAAWAQVEGDWADDLPDPVVPFAPHRARTLAQAQQPPAEPPRIEGLELTDTDGNPLTVLDEAALQEIVRQIIREELQGGLGERITRNVRKLVRAEINRALTARALD